MDRCTYHIQCTYTVMDRDTSHLIGTAHSSKPRTMLYPTAITLPAMHINSCDVTLVVCRSDYNYSLLYETSPMRIRGWFIACTGTCYTLIVQRVIKRNAVSLEITLHFSHILSSSPRNVENTWKYIEIMCIARTLTRKKADTDIKQ